METTAEVPDPFGPMLCFDLYAASRALTAAYRPLLKPLGLTYPQYLVLVTLWPNRERTIGEVGEQLCLDYGTLTPLIRRMETNGLLQRAPAGDDERLVVLRLSARGRRLSREQPAIQRAIQDDRSRPGRCRGPTDRAPPPLGP